MVHRKAFTIVEMLVALALVIFIMSILSEAFYVATQSFRNLKAVGDMAERLRVADRLIRRDLTANHFNEASPRMSDPTFWNNGPPTEGFFRIYHGSLLNTPATYAVEGYDLDGLPSYRAIDHMLHFTVKLRGNAPSDFLSAAVPALPSPIPATPAAPVPIPYPQQWNINGGTNPWTRYQDPNGSIFSSQWAEVAYFLQKTGDKTTGPVPKDLYALYRRQRLLLPDTSQQRWGDSAANISLYPEVSIYNNGTYGIFNSPIDMTIPYRRFGMDANGLLVGGQYSVLTGQDAGADVLLTDVISFEVRPFFGLSDGTNLVGTSPGNATVPLAFVPLSDPVVLPFRSNNPKFYGVTGKVPPFVFDTWSQAGLTSENATDYSTSTTTAAAAIGKSTFVPLYQNANRIKLSPKAIQIVIRIWDYKTNQTRQRTIIQDL